AKEGQLGAGCQAVVFRHAAERQAWRHRETLGCLFQEPLEGRDESQVVEDGRPEPGTKLAQLGDELACHALPVPEHPIRAAAEKDRLLKRSVMEVTRNSPA